MNTPASLENCKTQPEALAYINSEMRGFTRTQKSEFFTAWLLGHPQPASEPDNTFRRASIERRLKLNLRPEKRAALEAELASLA